MPLAVFGLGFLSGAAVVVAIPVIALAWIGYNKMEEKKAEDAKATAEAEANKTVH